MDFMRPKATMLAVALCLHLAAGAQATTYADVAPIFATRCAKCHAERGLMGPAPEGYRLNSYEATLSTVDRVRVVPGHPEASELVRRIRGQALPRMPFDGPPLEVAARARRDDLPAPGDYVEVRGRIGRDGAVAVERIRPR